MTEIKNYGFLPSEPDPQDFTFGALSNRYEGREVLSPSSDWTDFLPVIEQQNISFETNACVSFGTANVIEIIRRRLFDNKDNLSDRFIAKGSGTDPLRGNTPKKVADFIRHNWSVFENEWPMTGTVEEFYTDVPNHLKTLAISRGAEYEFGYELIQKQDIREALKYSPLGLSVPAWFTDEQGIYYRPGTASDNHWVCCFAIKPNGNLMILDTYFPFIKELRADVTPVNIYGYYLKRQIVNESAWSKFTSFISELLASLFPSVEERYEPKIEPMPEPVKEKVAEPKKDYIQLWAEAIREFEGYEPHHLAYKNCNPGNLKNTNGTWKVFATHEEGFAALKDYLVRACTGVHKAYRPDFTLRQFTAVYAPDGEKIINAYSSFVAKKLGVFPSVKIKDLYTGNV